MATTIGIYGLSGSGKTTSLRDIDPKSSYYINADKKSLPFKGWKQNWNSDKNKNYLASSDHRTIKQKLVNISEKAPHIKLVIVDTVNGIMIDDEMSRSKEKGYDKWIDLAQCVYELIRDSNSLRDDLQVVYIFHEEVFTDDAGIVLRRFVTNGKKLNKIKLETKLTYVVRSFIETGVEGNKYFFETHANNSVSKTGFGLFKESKIENNFKTLSDAIREFEG